MRKSPPIRFAIFITTHQLLPKLLCATMPPSDQHKESKVQDAIALIKQNPGLSVIEAARASYWRLTRHLNGVPRSSSRGGHNKKLDEPESKALREYLLICHGMGRGANIDNTIAAANSIL
jgi:hypothetical protein